MQSNRMINMAIELNSVLDVSVTAVGFIGLRIIW